MWDLTSLTRDQTHIPCIGSMELNTGPPGKSQVLSLLPNSLGFLGGSVVKESTCNAGDPGLILGLGKFPGEGNSNPLQYSCLGKPMNRGNWLATVQGVARVGHNLATKPPPSPPNYPIINLKNVKLVIKGRMA